jgi:hypothetical protein
MFRFPFKLVAEHNCWMLLEKSTHLITALLDQATHVLHGVLKAATYEETLPALEDHFMDQHLAPTLSQSAKNEDPGRLRILARIFHSC